MGAPATHGCRAKKPSSTSSASHIEKPATSLSDTNTVTVHWESVQSPRFQNAEKPKTRSRCANPTRFLPLVTTTPITGIFKRTCTHRSVAKLLARILDKTVGSPQVLKCGIEIGEGLERAHRTGVVHR